MKKFVALLAPLVLVFILAPPASAETPGQSQYSKDRITAFINDVNRQDPVTWVISDRITVRPSTGDADPNGVVADVLMLWTTSGQQYVIGIGSQLIPPMEFTAEAHGYPDCRVVLGGDALGRFYELPPEWAKPGFTQSLLQRKQASLYEPSAVESLGLYDNGVRVGCVNVAAVAQPS